MGGCQTVFPRKVHSQTVRVEDDHFEVEVVKFMELAEVTKGLRPLPRGSRIG
jgi:hypothetical protein